MFTCLLLREQLYKHCCVSIYLLISLFICPSLISVIHKFSESVKETFFKLSNLATRPPWQTWNMPMDYFTMNYAIVVLCVDMCKIFRDINIKNNRGNPLASWGGFFLKMRSRLFQHFALWRSTFSILMWTVLYTTCSE